MRFFNTAGPVTPAKHYCIPPIERWDKSEIFELIAQEKCFMLHAPRQTGKTSSLLALRDQLNEEGSYACVYINVEGGQAAGEDVERVIKVVLSQVAAGARRQLNDDYIDKVWSAILDEVGEDNALFEVLARWAENTSKPLVLMIDEIDSLIGNGLISVLRQLRAGYTQRPAAFPSSLILCGVCDVRDYKFQTGPAKTIVTGGSAFNIKAESLRLGDLTLAEVKELLNQHTQDTSQKFTREAVDCIWENTKGQPWLVNALAYQICFKSSEGKDRNNQITVPMVLKAREKLIVRRDTHLDQLADKLREPRVRRVIEPILSGDSAPEAISTDDIDYVADLGLIKRDGNITIANPIYREIIPRQLVHAEQETISHKTEWYVSANGHLDINKLLEAFQALFREHSDHWLEKFDYKEAGPQLLLQAFLQRIINGGGRVEREYGLGRGRTDIMIVWPAHKGEQRAVIELKLLREKKSPTKTIEEGLAQTAKYMDCCGTKEGHLLVFDRRKGSSWEDRIFHRLEELGEHSIYLWGL